MSICRVLRSCTTSLSSRSLARPAALTSQCRYQQRHYSETTTEPPKSGQPEQDSAQTETPKEEPSPELQKLQAKEAEVLDLTSRLRYLQADFQNLQRNSAREKEQTRDFAVTRFAGDLLETVDVLSLALNSVPKSLVSPLSLEEQSTSPAPPPTKTPEEYLRELYEGVDLTQKQLLSTLFKYQVKPFDPTGDKFDPNRHEALFQAPSPDAPPGTVTQCLKTGYMIKDRVLRAAQVGVAQEPQ